MKYMKKYILSVILPGLLLFNAAGQSGFSKVWVADNVDGTFKNPVINADYSDPDAIRVGDDYYMISSSFNHIPGLPILHSKDLVNWKIIGHALNASRHLIISVKCSMAMVFGRLPSVIIKMNSISIILTPI